MGDLFVCAKAGDHRRLKSLLESDPSLLNARDSDGRTALFLATNSGHLRAVEVLLERGADPNSPDNKGLTAMHAAASGGHDDALKLLGEKHGDAGRLTTDERQWSCLHFAVHAGYQSTVKALLFDLCADPNVLGARMWTPLHQAAFLGRVGCIQELLNAGASCLKRNAAGKTPSGLAKDKKLTKCYEVIQRVKKPQLELATRMEKKQWKEARRILKDTMTKERPGDRFAWYQLAECEAALGGGEEAVVYLGHAYDAGFNDQALIDVNPLFQGLRSLPAYQQLKQRREQRLRSDGARRRGVRLCDACHRPSGQGARVTLASGERPWYCKSCAVRVLRHFGYDADGKPSGTAAAAAAASSPTSSSVSQYQPHPNAGKPWPGAAGGSANEPLEPVLQRLGLGGQWPRFAAASILDMAGLGQQTDDSLRQLGINDARHRRQLLEHVSRDAEQRATLTRAAQAMAVLQTGVPADRLAQQDALRASYGELPEGPLSAGLAARGRRDSSGQPDQYNFMPAVSGAALPPLAGDGASASTGTGDLYGQLRLSTTGSQDVYAAPQPPGVSGLPSSVLRTSSSSNVGSTRGSGVMKSAGGGGGDGAGAPLRQQYTAVGAAAAPPAGGQNYVDVPQLDSGGASSSPSPMYKPVPGDAQRQRQQPAGLVHKTAQYANVDLQSSPALTRAFEASMQAAVKPLGNPVKAPRPASNHYQDVDGKPLQMDGDGGSGAPASEPVVANADLLERPFFHPNFDRAAAENFLLSEGQPVGAFVVRPSRLPGALSLSHHKPDDSVGHCIINTHGEPGSAEFHYTLEHEDEKFSRLDDLLKSLPDLLFDA